LQWWQLIRSFRFFGLLLTHNQLMHQQLA
jgi:hypothetical protein